MYLACSESQENASSGYKMRSLSIEQHVNTEVHVNVQLHPALGATNSSSGVYAEGREV